MKAGYIARQRVTTAVHSKTLRLNQATAAALGGKIVNLASSDVRRLEDVGPFWPFLVAAPAELLIVAGLLATRLGPGAAGGVALILAFLPLQAALSRRIGGLRTATAACTDARARTLAEAVHGALAVKMLGLEPVLLKRTVDARAREAAPATSAARIRALNLALYYIVYPVSVFCLVLAVWAGGRRPPVADIFFALALLRLPQLYMGIFFMRAVESTAELAASLARLDAFLGLQEPPPPPHAVGVPGADTLPADVAVAFRGCDFVWPPPTAAPESGGGGDGGAAPGPAAASAEDPPPPPRVVVVAATDDAPITPPARASSDAPRRSSVDMLLIGPALQGVNLMIKRGELIGVAGDVGSGKSALLQALLAELYPVGLPDTHPAVRGTVSYCAQTPWIVSGTLKANVVGFSGDDAAAADASRYTAALDAAALTPDIAALPGGDATEIGERGVNLSGGQRARVALARAAHARADVALLDDPLSALDARVGAAVFDRCIGPGSLLEGTTRVLVTHARHYLPRCDRVVILRGGRVAHVGTPAELAALGVPELAPSATAPPVDVDAAADAADDLDAVADEDEEAGTAVAATEPPLPPSTAPTTKEVMLPSVFASADAPPPSSKPRRADAAARMKRDLSRLVARGGRDGGGGGGQLGGASLTSPLRSFVAALSRRLTSTLRPSGSMTLRVSSSTQQPSPPPPRPAGALTSDEGRAAGGVSLAVYRAWLARVGALPCTLVGAALILGQRAYLFAEWWSSTLGAVGATPAGGGITATIAGRSVDASLWLAVYGGVTGALVVIALARAQVFFGAAVAASTRLHNDMAAATLRAPLSFFHTTPAGRILNRFTKDQGIADDYLPMVAFDALQSVLLVGGSLVMMAVAVPAVLPIFIPLAAAFAFFRGRYLAATRDVKRFDGTTRSPVFAALGETPRGLATVRAYGVAPRFRATFAGLAGRNLSWWAAFVACARWLGVRLDAVATVALAAEAALLTGLAHKVDPRLAGLALTNSIGLAGSLQWAVRQVAEWKVSMTSVERMQELTFSPPNHRHARSAARRRRPGGRRTAASSLTV